MKTPMQFLKDEIESKVFPLTYNNGNLTDYQYGHNIAYSVVLTLAEYLIEKEKEQIIDSFDYGYHCASNGTSAEITLDGKIYYNQTYNKNK